MKLTTNSILILFGIFAFAVVACLPISMLAMPLIKPTQSAPSNTAATVQAMVTQTMYALTQNDHATPSLQQRPRFRLPVRLLRRPTRLFPQRRLFRTATGLHS